MLGSTVVSNHSSKGNLKRTHYHVAVGVDKNRRSYSIFFTLEQTQWAYINSFSSSRCIIYTVHVHIQTETAGSTIQQTTQNLFAT